MKQQRSEESSIDHSVEDPSPCLAEFTTSKVEGFRMTTMKNTLNKKKRRQGEFSCRRFEAFFLIFFARVRLYAVEATRSVAVTPDELAEANSRATVLPLVTRTQALIMDHFWSVPDASALQCIVSSWPVPRFPCSCRAGSHITGAFEPQG